MIFIPSLSMWEYLDKFGKTVSVVEWIVYLNNGLLASKTSLFQTIGKLTDGSHLLNNSTHCPVMCWPPSFRAYHVWSTNPCLKCFYMAPLSHIKVVKRQAETGFLFVIIFYQAIKEFYQHLLKIHHALKLFFLLNLCLLSIWKAERQRFSIHSSHPHNWQGRTRLKARGPSHVFHVRSKDLSISAITSASQDVISRKLELKAEWRLVPRDSNNRINASQAVS